MRRRLGALTGLLLTAGLTTVPPPATGIAADEGPPQGTVAPAGLAVTVAGEGVETWPAYDAALGRFAIDTSEATAGQVQVTVSAKDPAAQVALNGAEALLVAGPSRASSTPPTGSPHPGRRSTAPPASYAGIESERYLLTGRPGGRDWSVRYLHRGRDITRRLVAGRLTPRLEQGESWAFRIVVRRTARVLDGGERLTWVRARSRTDTEGRDRISVVSRAR